MVNKELTRENINYELTGLGMQLRYLRDALMCSFMDIPINYFFELRGNLPVAMDERMPFLERMVAAVDVKFFKDAKAQIFNTNDMELALKFCELDLVVWQLTMLAYRYEEEHQALAHIAEKVGELLKLVHFLKTGMLHKNFFCFNGIEEIQMTDLLEKVARERAQSGSAHGEYAG